MRIAYIAKHNSGGNDDEGAISYALGQLGHSVTELQEGTFIRDYRGIDLILFHAWSVPSMIKTVRIPKVFWYFDMINPTGDSTANRSLIRKVWMNRTIPLVDLGFCTDGDWVNHYNPICKSKLVWLPQGADERIVGTVPPTHCGTFPNPDLLLTAIMRGGGEPRINFVRWCRAMYRTKLHHIQRGTYREELKQLTANSKVVLAPDAPASNNYWSNRVYNAAGFGACILHPYCSKLAEHYIHDKEIVYYTDRRNLQSKIEYLLSPDNTDYRQELGANALARTMSEHLYRHRCITLLQTVSERLGVR